MSSRKFKVLVTHPEIPSAAIQKLAQKCDLVTCTELPYASREQILSKVTKDLDGILWLSKQRMDKEIMDLAGFLHNFFANIYKYKNPLTFSRKN